MIRNILFLFCLFILLNCFFQVFGQTPPVGWFIEENSPQQYQVGVDSTIFYGKAPSGFIKSLPNVKENGFGTLMQNFIPKDYLGKQVQLSCFIKYNNVLSWTGIWIRVDSVNGGIDNMYDRRLNGTSDWKSVSSTVNVPEDTTVLDFGDGEAWLDDCSFEVVDPPMENVNFPIPISNPDVANSGMLPYPISLSF
ncbi:helix-turn-helix transcriptional regulator [Rhizophagus clarus]|uniref:Helix-turn-helix transcriptional regulator n=1 Tax=Rhizophagus clarus TaxID=94130 RepID=A0A8H3R4M3_9GLOM|nr:helix-turn-helix transcriptional regulator [Rhizophagus clarus]